MIKRLIGLGLCALVLLLFTQVLPKRSILDHLGTPEEAPQLETASILEAEVETVTKADVAIEQLSARLNSIESTLSDLSALQAQVGGLDTKYDDLYGRYQSVNDLIVNLKGIIDRTHALQESMQKDMLGRLQQSAADTTPVKSAQAPAKTLTFVYGDQCAPCDAWKRSEDRAAIAADTQIQSIHMRDLPLDQRPKNVPSYTLTIGGMQARHSGYLTLGRFRDMERAILQKLRSP